MSNEEEQQNKVVITHEDVKNVKDFFSHFNIPLAEYLTTTLNEIENAEEVTLELQDKMRINIARAIFESEHEIFKDDLFSEVIPNCEKAWFDAQFSQDFEDAMTSDQQGS
jgi:hypothetical protein